MSARDPVNQNQDLPSELWLEILSYLPPYTLSTKLIGVSRYLFEAGMNEVYGEVCVGVPMIAFEKSVAQLRYESVRRRVRKVHISAGCRLFKQNFSTAGRGVGESVGGRGGVELVGIGGILEKLKGLLFGYANSDFGAGAMTGEANNEAGVNEDPERDYKLISGMPSLLSLAIHRLDECQNLQNITIEALGTEEPVTPLYAHFISVLLSTIHRKGMTIRILNIDLDLNNWRNESDFESSKTTFSVLPAGSTLTAFKDLAELHISLETLVKLPTGTGEYASCVEQLRNVVFEARDTLESLVVLMRTEKHLPCDVAEIFPWRTMISITFPALKKIKIHSEVYGLNIIRPKTFAKFLAFCATNLESLTLQHEGKGHPTRRGHLSSVVEIAMKRRLVDVWDELIMIGRRMPQLRELAVSLSVIEVDALVGVFEMGLVPGLRKVVLTPLDGYALPFDVYKRVLKAIAIGTSRSENSVLEEIQVYVRSLSPSHLEILQNLFPGLKKVYLVYRHLCTEPDASRKDEDTADAIYAAFQTSAHVDWRSRDVRFEEMEFDGRFEGNPHKELQRRIQV